MFHVLFIFMLGLGSCLLSIFSTMKLLLNHKSTFIQVASIADAVYGVWAKYRLQITG